MGTNYLNVTGSFGVAQCRDNNQTSEELVNLADQALLCAKRMGRDRVVCYTSLADAAEPQLSCSARHGAILAGKLARDVMVPLTVCLREDDTVEEAAGFFLQFSIPATPVLAADGALAGLISEKDIMATMVSPECRQRPLSSTMYSKAICYEEDTPVRVIHEFLCRVSVRGVVITNQGRPTGMITHGSLLRWFHDWIVRNDSDSPPSLTSSLCECNTTGTASAPSPHNRDNAPVSPSARQSRLPVVGVRSSRDAALEQWR